MKRLLAGGAILSMVAALVLAGAPANARPASAVPPDFHAQSMSWITAQHGWMLGTAPCGSSTCTTVLGTTDAGATWNTVGTINAPMTFERASGVTEIRFADDLHGWAFDPAAWVTNDGGVTWSKLRPPGNRPVIAMAGDAQGFYGVVSACGYGIPISNCEHPTTLWRITPGQSAWTQIQLTLPVANQAILAVHGLVAYVVVPAALSADASTAPIDGLAVTTDGQTWSTRPDPCNPANGETLTGITPVSDTRVALLCQGNIGFGKAAKLVYISNDNGQTTSPDGRISWWGIVSQLAAAPNGTLILTSYSIGSWIYRNAGGKVWTTSVDLGDGGMGWNDVVMTTNDVGYVIHGPAAVCCRGMSGELWTTTDGGLTWGPA
jgi:hypothetical protein